MNTVGYFEIQSSDPIKAIQFYEDLFGWRFIKESNVPIVYYRIETDGIHGGLLERPAKIPPQDCGTNAFLCSVQVADFDKTSSKILEKGGRIAMPKFAIKGRCWQGYFLDLDQNAFGIFQADENAK